MRCSFLVEYLPRVTDSRRYLIQHDHSQHTVAVVMGNLTQRRVFLKTLNIPFHSQCQELM